MRKLPLLLLYYCLFGQTLLAQKTASGLKAENVPEFSKKLLKQYAEYKDYYAATLIGWTGGGELMYSADLGGGVQVCVLDTTVVMPDPITKFTEMPRGIKPGPRASHGYTFRKGDGWQYFFYDSHKRRVKALTRPGELAMGSCSGIEKFAFASNRRNGRDFDIYTTTVGDPDTAVRVSKGAGQWMPLSFSPDEKQLLLAFYPKKGYNQLHILELSTGETTLITDPDSKTWINHDARFSNDGKRIQYSGEDFWIYDLRTRSTSNLSAGGVGKVTAFSEAKKSGIYAYAIEDEEGGILHLLDPAGHETHKVKIPGGATVTKMVFSPKELKLAVSLQSAKAPDRVATYNFGKDKWTEKTFVTTELSSKFIGARKITYPTFDSDGGKPRELEATYFEPTTEGKHPVFIELHSELGRHADSYFDPFKQYLINELDMAVIIPNFRGSQGYGREFQDLDNKYGKRDAIKDIGMLLDWIELQENLDASKVIVYGVSQGGRMAMSVMSQYNDRLVGGISGAGVYDLLKYFPLLAPDKVEEMKKEFGDWTQPEFKTFLRDISPIQHAGQIKNPVFLFHSEKDKLVSPKQTLKFKEALKQNGNLAWYLSAPGSGHYVWKKSKQTYLEQALILFIEHALKAKKK